MKLHEEVGELTQAHLMRQGQARSKGLTPPRPGASSCTYGVPSSGRTRFQTGRPGRFGSPEAANLDQ